MRTIGSRSNVLFILAAAAGLSPLSGGLVRADAGADRGGGPDRRRHGPVEEFFSRLAREFTTASGTTGWHAFTSTDTILCVLVGVAVLSALATLIPAIEQPSREVLRLATFAMLGIVVVKLVNTPDAAGLVERRQGAWIALGVTGIMASSARRSTTPRCTAASAARASTSGRRWSRLSARTCSTRPDADRRHGRAAAARSRRCSPGRVGL